MIYYFNTNMLVSPDETGQYQVILTRPWMTSVSQLDGPVDMVCDQVMYTL